ncbi:hypothetical protein SCA6_001657 [Theobroma cacao]
MPLLETCWVVLIDFISDMASYGGKLDAWMMTIGNTHKCIVRHNNVPKRYNYVTTSSLLQMFHDKKGTLSMIVFEGKNNDRFHFPPCRVEVQYHGGSFLLINFLSYTEPKGGKKEVTYYLGDVLMSNTASSASSTSLNLKFYRGGVLGLTLHLEYNLSLGFW